jgi:hypothetical protein
LLVVTGSSIWDFRLRILDLKDLMIRIRVAGQYY